MPHYKTPDNRVYFLDDAEFVHLLPAGCEPISDAEANQLRAPSLDELAREGRAERDAKLAACDWVMVRAFERDRLVPLEWAAYRQALRDVTDQPGFPENIVWPELPQ